MESQPTKESHGLRITLAAAAALALLSVLGCIGIVGVGLWRATAQPRQTVAPPTPSPQPSPSPEHVMLLPNPTLPPAPPGWQEYRSITGVFTLRYPSTWQVTSEEEFSVMFDMGDHTSSSFSLVLPNCHEGESTDSTVVLDCLVRLVHESWLSDDQAFRLRSRDLWQDGDWRGYLVEADVTRMYEDSGVEDYAAWLLVPVQSDVSLIAWLAKIDADDVPADEWRAFIEAVKSMRPGGAQQ